ncbi:MAG: S46 family peptidase [Pseudomonadales bacterium]|nr:S46 family peptidase [Pseudomonadales bacterium]
MRKYFIAAVSAALVLLTSIPALADEGMWTYHDFPSAAVAAKFGVTIDQAWLDRARLGTIRLANCTASFVSPNGLILTNHHCVESCLAELSTQQNDLVGNGFLAGDRAKERRCQTQIADVLVGMTNITDRIAAAVAGKSDRTANDARKKALTESEQNCEANSRKDRKSGPLKCETVNLYNGGQYWLYQYKRYTDVRLVFAPERDIAAFGGDPDNFQFPRWCLDMGVLRAYENGKPAQTPQHLNVNFDGPKAGELVFVSGHPGSTDRLLTVAQLETQRDIDIPRWLLRAAELRGRYVQYAKSSDEAARSVEDQLNGLENSIKVRRKQLDALLDDKLIAAKRDAETKLRASVAADPKLAAAIGDPWSDIAKAQAVYRTLQLPLTFIENGAGWGGHLANYARVLVRAADERAKANTDRLREYTDTALPRIEQQLAAAVPIYPEIEIIRLTFGLERMREWLGPDHPLVRELLSKESPDELAHRLVSGTKLNDPSVRLALWNGGRQAIDASDDPMIVFSREVEPEARALRKRYDDEVEAPVEAASEKIARARFAALGTSVYPDATFTLRLNYGTVQGWRENGVEIAPFTHLSRLYERATGAEPFKVPDRWLAAKPRLDMTTRFDLSTNNDIVGGNSGSPLINAKGEVVGLVFDGNIHSISGSYWFDTAMNRTVAVDTTIIRTALHDVYDARALAEELGIR